MLTASRLVLARKRRGLSLVQLSSEVGVTAQSLSNYENERQEPLPQVIEQIARVLNFPVSFFSLPEIDLLETEALSFRARSKLPARKRDMALSVGRLAAEFDDWMSERFRLPEPDLPSLSKPDPETAASMLRARWGLGSAPLGNMIHLLEAHGIRVFSLYPEYSEVDASHSSTTTGRSFSSTCPRPPNAGGLTPRMNSGTLCYTAKGAIWQGLAQSKKPMTSQARS